MSILTAFREKYTEKEIFSGIVLEDDVILNWVYINYLPAVTKLVLKNKGTLEEARDIFHDALFVTSSVRLLI